MTFVQSASAARCQLLMKQSFLFQLKDEGRSFQSSLPMGMKAPAGDVQPPTRGFSLCFFLPMMSRSEMLAGLACTRPRARASRNSFLMICILGWWDNLKFAW